MKKLLSLVLIVTLLLGSSSSVVAEVSDASLTLEERKAIITEVAIQNKIPPEILKAIAMRESKMRQFDDNGEYLGSFDGGMGIMQVTPFGSQVDEFDLDRLKTDIRYNVQIGAEILLEKWSWAYLPAVNNKDWQVLENWYFALLGYNGVSQRNDPAYTPETPSYQEAIYQMIEEHSQTSAVQIGDFDVTYSEDEATSHLMQFPNKHIIWEEADTVSTQLFRPHDEVVTWNEIGVAYLRDGVDGEKLAALDLGIKLKIVDGPYESSKLENHFAYYHVIGEEIDGYIASANLAYADERDEIDYQPMNEEIKVADSNKTWTVQFNTSIDRRSILNQTIYVENAKGEKVRTDLDVLADGKSVEVKAPFGGYDVNETYTLYVHEDITSKAQMKLKEPKKVTFIIN